MLSKSKLKIIQVNKPRIKKWHYEVFFVSIILGATAYFSGHKIVDWIEALGILFLFLNTQVSFESPGLHQNNEAKPDQIWAARYFTIQRFLFLITFILLKTWPLLVGCIITESYIYWRRWFRDWMQKKKISVNLKKINGTK